jgi:hypothetical protein
MLNKIGYVAREHDRVRQLFYSMAASLYPVEALVALAGTLIKDGSLIHACRCTPHALLGTAYLAAGWVKIQKGELDSAHVTFSIAARHLQGIGKTLGSEDLEKNLGEVTGSLKDRLMSAIRWKDYWQGNG